MDPAAGTEPPNWRVLADRYWDELLAIEPILGTEVGDERFDDRLPDLTEQGRATRQRVHRDALDGMAAIDRVSLDMVGRTTFDVMEAIATRDLASLEHRLDRFSPVNHLWGPGTILADLGTLTRADTPERRDTYLRRLNAMPEYLEGAGELAREGAAAGQTVPGVVADRAVAQVERLLQLSPEDSPALQPLGEASEEERQPFLDVIRDVVWPAYERFLGVLREYRPAARDSIGLLALPNGDAMYAAEIRSWTTLDLPAKEIHDMGVESLEQIQEERRVIARSLGHEDPQTAIQEYGATGANLAKSREDMVRLAAEQVQRGWEAAPRFFGRLPTANCEVRAIEEYREADMPFAFYMAPREDGERPGIYYVNTSDLAERPLHHLATTTYHEANPGHHFQVSLEMEMDDRPPVRRFGGILAGSAFIEGWGLYSERLADEMGIFENEIERLGMLDAQAMRSARLVVDTGLHAFGWDRDRAIDKMVEAGVPHLDATIEVDRYVAMPAQALSYRIGQLEIERLRAEATRREGPRFSLRDFHDRLLALGSVPLTSLARELDGGP